MRHLYESHSYPDTGKPGWDDGPGTWELIEVLRSTLHEGYSDVSDEEIDEALGNVMGSLTPAEAFNFTSALNRIGKSAGHLVSDPAFASVARTALPVAGRAAGTLIGGPAGTVAGDRLGSLAASALPARPALTPATGRTSLPTAPSAPGSPATASAPNASVTAQPKMEPVPAVAGGSRAATQCLVLTQQPEFLRCLLATALGQHGRQTVSGIPVAEVLGLLSQVFGKAAADADELMYLYRQPDAAESTPDASDDLADVLYADLLGADNMELAEAADWDWQDQ